ncbi:paraquat-inducible protein A [uncultured Tateyamaria sp.]|uniref:paraquat-inducible protein A n=1 Tax=uncultured Tateyamaria sp. TaxID=455651 RepID=UPI002620C6E1|nr:paraquat-inducible protein A [uncultured Tateyamaria sp.]
MTVTARDKGLVCCRECARVWPSGQSHCGTCGNTLRSRDDQSLHKVWAWWAAGVIAYIPANIYPMLKTRTLLHTSEDTIIAGALEIAAHGSFGVALIILLASVVIPLGKFFAIAYLALAVRRRARWPARRQYILYEVVEYIGRWSMIDVFVVAILCSLVQLNVAASITPGVAALTFALSVIFTMLSAQSFDPRLIWDRIDTQQKASPV